MKIKPSQSIYDTRGNPPAEEGSASPINNMEGMDLFVRDILRRQQRQTIFLYFMIGLAGLLLAGMISFWFSKSRAVSNAARFEAVTNVAEVSYSLRPAETPPLYLIDPLKQIAPLPLPTNAPAEWSADWIKQAVYHLLQAEKFATNDRLEAAVEEYTAALKIFPALKGVHKQLGLNYLQQKKYKEAATEFEQVMKEEPPSFGVMNNISVAYLGMGNLEKAERALLETVKIDTNYPLAYFNLAMLYQKLSDLPKSVDYLDLYTRLRPDDLPAGENQAMILLQLQRWEKAAAVLANLGHALPQSSVIHFRLAQALSHLEGRQDAALDTLEHAINLVDSRKALSWLTRSEFDVLRKQPRFKKLIDDLSVQGKN